MSDEPLLKRRLQRLLGRNKAEDAERSAFELTGGLPTELMSILKDDQHSTPVLLRKLQAAVKREHLKVDIAILEEHARKLNAGKNVIDAITALRTSAHRARELDTQLKRADELAEGKHQTSLLGEAAEQAKQSGAIDEHRTAQLRGKLDREQLRRRIASLRARPLDDDFEERARSQMHEHDDVLVAYARLESEIRARRDIVESAKDAAIEWLKELTAEELRRRMDKAHPHS